MKEKYLVQTLEEDERKGVRKQSTRTRMGTEKERIHARKGRERKGRRTITYLQFNCKSN